MRRAIVAGGAAVAVVATAFVVAPTVWSQTKAPREKADRRVVMLDGRGSTIGVSIRDLETEDVEKTKAGATGGVLIEDVDEGSPAAKAGIREGDVVVEFDGERVRSARQFARLVQETPGGRAVKTTVMREGTRQTLDIVPERSTRLSGDFVLPDLDKDIEREIERGMRSLPRDFAFDFNWKGDFPDVAVFPRGRLGAELSPLSDQLAAYFGAKAGVLVSSVAADSVAAKAGLKAGDVITSVNGQSVDTPRDVVRELREAEAGAQVEIAVLRDKKSMTLKAQMPERRRTTNRQPTRPA